METIMIAGGTGLIGQALEKKLLSKGHAVRILTRNPTQKNHYYWNPSKKEIDEIALQEVTVFINLSGAGIAEKRWTSARKLELAASRIGTNTFLASKLSKFPKLKQFISSSGINCYPLDNTSKIYTEEDDFGTDYLSQLVKDWEASADLFEKKCVVAKIRTAVVLSPNGGALSKMIPAIKMGIGSPLGSGNQAMAWIHIDDLVDLFTFVLENKLAGAYNAVTACTSNKNFMKSLANHLNKPFWFPNVPSFVLKIIFGEMSTVLLDGVQVSNQKITDLGFKFHKNILEQALN
jgi:uncharacterized protein (TIGR01777 family)